jgi:hypothetical protein
MSVLSALGLLIILNSAAPLKEFAPDHGMAYQATSQEVVPHDVSFDTKGALHGITEDGCEFSKTGWRSSDGKTVFLEINYCKSSAHAQRVLNKFVRKATKIFEKGTLTGKDGKKSGDRIVVTFTKNLIKRPEMILWTEGNKIYIVESTSFGHALVFEKKFPNV